MAVQGKAKIKIGKRKLFWLGAIFFILVVIIIYFWQTRFNIEQPTYFTDNYFYENKSLGFAVYLPSSFKHFQTQRKKGSNYVEIEFFVPTSDRYYHQLVPGYAQPFAIRLIDKSLWAKYKQDNNWQLLGFKNHKAYIISFWQKLPADWQEKWSLKDQKNIKKSIMIN